jgi:long-chain acyl-CoA synthetase
MVVTEGGKNIYPEDIETFFEGLPVKEFCVFAADYLWAERSMGRDSLVIVLRVEHAPEFSDALRSELAQRNRRLPDFKRIQGYVLWNRDFPRTASFKIKREVLAEEIRQSLDRAAAVVEL